MKSECSQMTQTHLWILLLSLLMLAEVEDIWKSRKNAVFWSGGGGGAPQQGKLVHFVAVPVHEREGDGEVAVIVQTRVAVLLYLCWFDNLWYCFYCHFFYTVV